MIPRLAPYLPAAILGGCAVYVAVLAWRGRRPGPHADGCLCDLCRAFEAVVRDACAFAADVVPGLVPRDGEPLTRAERRALRGIEAVSRHPSAAHHHQRPGGQA